MQSSSGGPNRVPSSRHPSVTALLLSSPGAKDPKVVMRTRAKAKVAEAKARRWSGPPFCPRELCSMFGIRSFEVSHEIGGDGRILLGPDGRPRIEYAAGRMPVRQRFTIFHEFAHTLFPDYCEFLPCHHTSDVPISKADKEFEGLCDVGAAEMLFPEEEFLSDMVKIDWLGFSVIKALHDRYEASIDATSRRLAALSTNIGFSFTFLTDCPDGFNGRGPLWVNYSVNSTAFKGYIPSGVVPPASSAAIACFRDGVTTQPAKETWWINGKPRSYMVQATRLPEVSDPKYPKVLALLLPQSYKGGPP